MRINKEDICTEQNTPRHRGYKPQYSEREVQRDRIYRRHSYSKKDFQKQRTLRRQRIKRRNARLLSGFIFLTLIFFILQHCTIFENTKLANAVNMSIESDFSGYDANNQTKTATEKRQKCIIIDPGHGGTDPGSIFHDIYESNINLPIAIKVKTYLEELGYVVIMTREDDVFISPYDRVNIANDANADLLISIHHNSLEDDQITEGMETLYNEAANPLNSILADYIQNEASSTTNAKNRGTLANKKVILIREVAIPSCLIEIGFLSSNRERPLLLSSDYQEKSAQGIVNGIINFFENTG